MLSRQFFLFLLILLSIPIYSYSMKAPIKEYQVNNYTWHAALEVLAEVFVIEKADRNNGLIVTSWHKPNNDMARYNMLITVNGLSDIAKSFKIFVKKEVMKSGNWVQARPDLGIKQGIRGKILQKAESLRMQDVIAAMQ